MGSTLRALEGLQVASHAKRVLAQVDREVVIMVLSSWFCHHEKRKGCDGGADGGRCVGKSDEGGERGIQGQSPTASQGTAQRLPS